MSAARRPITINFASTDHHLLDRAFLALSAVAVVLALIAGALILQARSYQAQYGTVEKNRETLAANMEKHRPVMEERQRLTQNLSAMTTLLDARDFSWVRLLSALEHAFPPGVGLNGFAFTAKGNMVSLDGKATSPEALSGLMIGLEKSGSFRSPQLKHQSLDKGTIEFNVAVIYHGAPAGGQPQEPGRTGR